jgi:AraC-like DNA-binding protein
MKPEVGYAWQRLRESRGAVSVASLAEETGWSVRHLSAQFRRRGILADLAAECGYYDQAHLAREFRDLAGCPPSRWLAEEFRNVQAALPDDWE